MGGNRRAFQVQVCFGAALLATGMEDACPAYSGDCAAAGAGRRAGGEYFYPHGRGHPRYFGQSPFAFGSPRCNLSASLKWSWNHPNGRYFTVFTGKPIVDNEMNIYISTEDAIRKLSPEGALLWTWLVPDFKHLAREIPNNAAIMDGLLFNCLTSGEVFALDMRSGSLVWMVKVSDRGIGTENSFTTALEGMVLLAIEQASPPDTHNKVIALNSTDGRLLWEFRPDTGVWNFLPHFPGDGSFLFQSWTGAAYRVNLSDGKQLWRAGALPGDVTWTDGGSALGPNGIFYTVSSTGVQNEAPSSTGGGLHAFRVSDGKLMWEKTDFDQGIYTYPVVGHLNPGSDELSVVTGVGSLCGFPLRILWVASLPVALVVGLLLASCRHCCCNAIAERKRGRRCGCLMDALICFLGIALLFFAALALVLKKEFLSSVHAFEAETGRLQWRVDLPIWRNYASAGDAEGAFMRALNNRRYICLPLTSGYPTLDGQGALFMGHHDGNLYQIKDWNNDGHIDPEKEVCSFAAGGAFPTGGPTILPGLLLTTSCDTLYAFAQ